MGDLLVIMAQFTLKITLGNDAMQTGFNVAESLKKVSREIENYDYLLNPEMKGETGKIMDLNGNTVGSWQVK